MAKAETVLQTTFYIYPSFLIITLVGAQTLQFWRDRRQPRREAPRHEQTNASKARSSSRSFAKLLLSLQLLLSALLIASISLAAREAVAGEPVAPRKADFPFSSYLASYVGVLLYFLAGLLPDPDGSWSPSFAHGCAWVVGALVEALIAAILSFRQPFLPLPPSLINSLNALSVSRITVFLLMTVALILKSYRLKRLEPGSPPEERQSLLADQNGSLTSYASIPAQPATDSTKSTARATVGWLDYLAGFRTLFPYLWPKDSPAYQAIVVVCMGLLICQRVVNVLSPLQLGVLVDDLGEGRLPYKNIIVFVLYRSLQGNQGAIGALRSVLWIPVSQSLFRRLCCAAFEHVLGLSLEFHVNKKVGEVTSALGRGSAMNTFLEGFCFQVFPMVFDIFVAGVIFSIKYDAFYTIIVFFIMWSYIFLTIYLARYRGKQRRDMTIKAREMEAIKTDALLAYETVQHNCAVSRESQRFQDHVVVYQKAERIVQWSLNALNLTQSSIFTLGTALLVSVSAYKISIGEQTVGEFVTLINYFVQLQGPLSFFGTYYTMIQNNLIEAERILELFNEMPKVVEKADAISWPSPRGDVVFDNVKFAYNKEKGGPVMDGISFTVPSGTKTALVGESGAGKSTCLKLLFRFYDVCDGAITVDGQDLRDLKLDSLRQNIGIVPQDTVLFNATIMYNLLYANPKATEADVYEACKAANIHHSILAFADGYETRVGERGLKLSGGERQRIAIARAILKNARILLLDEATASLDTHTERQIQDALEYVTAGRTTITIAHRLSTITTSDQIVVLHKGKVAERGTHSELLALQGRYYAMWQKQTKTEKNKKEGIEDDEETLEASSQE